MVKLVSIPYSELKDMDIHVPDWLIEDILPEGTLCVLSAREKAGKGLLTIDAAVSIALGEDFLGKPTKQGKVIYLAAEETQAEVKSRLDARIPEGSDPPIEVIHLDGSFDGRLDLTMPDHVTQLRTYMEELNPTLLIIDVLREVHTAKEDLADEMSQVMRDLRSIAHCLGCTIIVNHHMSKAGNSRGSTSIQAGADVILELHGSTGEFTQLGGTLTAKGRSVPKLELQILFDGESKWHTSGSPAPTPRPTPTAKVKVVKFLQSIEGKVGVDDIATALEMSPKTIGNAISEIKKSDPTMLDETEGQGKGSPRRYSLKRHQQAA